MPSRQESLKRLFAFLEDNDVELICGATRYYLTRPRGDGQRWAEELIRIWPALSELVRDTIKRDIESAFHIQSYIQTENNPHRMLPETAAAWQQLLSAELTQ